MGSSTKTSKFHVPSGLGIPERGWSLDKAGYVIYTSRGKRHNIPRGTRLNRLVMSRLVGGGLPEDLDVHHQDFDKQHNCPGNLVLLPSVFNPRLEVRDPYTGQYLSKEQYVRRYGEPDTGVGAGAEDDEVPF